MHSDPFPKPIRRAVFLALALLIVVLPSCGPTSPKVDWSTRDEIPPDQLTPAMEAHYRGLGAMERYEYARAAEAFREVRRLAPGWNPGTINLAIALLNQGGEAKAKAKAAGQDDAELESNLEEAMRQLGRVIDRQPDNPWAHFSRGIVLQNAGKAQEAHLDFAKVIEVDPLDANAWLELGSTLTEPDGSNILPGSKLLTEQLACYSKAVELNPYLTTAIFKLSQAYRYSRNSARANELNARFMKLDPNMAPDGPGEPAVLAYGQMGRYARVIDPFTRPKTPEKVAPPPRFEPPIEILVALPPDHRWAKESDFTGPLAVIGRARTRFGQGVAVFDADRDGLPDLYLTSAVVGPKGVHDVLLRNLGDNKFDGTQTFGLPDDRAGLGVAAGDFDGDRGIDLFLTGVGDNRLCRNAGLHFEDVTQQAGIEGSAAISLTARWLDLDQDGDLDLYVINHATKADSDATFIAGSNPAGQANIAYRNDGKPAEVSPRPETNWAPLAMAPPDLVATKGLSLAFSTAFPGSEALKGGIKAHTAIAALDIDEDRDIDLVVSSDGEAPIAILNDRAGAFHAVPIDGLKPDGPIAGLLVLDFDKDGRPDLAAVGPGGRVSAWRNASTRTGGVAKMAWESVPIDALGWRAAQAVDVDLDTWPDLVGLPGDPQAPSGLELATESPEVRFETHPVPLPPDGLDADSCSSDFALADLVGDALPDLLILRNGLCPPGRPEPRAMATTGWRSTSPAAGSSSFDHMRTNSEGLGDPALARRAGDQRPLRPHDPGGGPRPVGRDGRAGDGLEYVGAFAPGPLARRGDAVRAERHRRQDLPGSSSRAGRRASCPVLFTWNGARSSSAWATSSAAEGSATSSSRATTVSPTATSRSPSPRANFSPSAASTA